MSTDDNTIKVDIPAQTQYLAMISSILEIYLARVPEIADREMTVYNVKLAAQECCTNIIDHAYGDQAGGRIKASLAIDDEPRRLIIEFQDTGAAVEPAAVAEPQLQVGSIRGYGLFLMHELMDEVNFSHDESGNRWQLVKLL